MPLTPTPLIFLFISHPLTPAPTLAHSLAVNSAALDLAEGAARKTAEAAMDAGRQLNPFMSSSGNRAVAAGPGLGQTPLEPVDESVVGLVVDERVVGLVVDERVVGAVVNERVVGAVVDERVVGLVVDERVVGAVGELREVAGRVGWKEGGKVSERGGGSVAWGLWVEMGG